MKIEHFDIEGPLLLTPDVYTDERGYFLESFNKERFKEATGLDVDFVQDNESMSNKGVLRGLHMQLDPYMQGKLVRVVSGSVLDVAVDMRKDSKTFGKYVSAKLTAKDKQQFYVPPGFAHGFLVLEDHTVFSYKCTAYYHKESEISVQWNDSELAIDWDCENPVLSDKDRNNAMDFKSFKTR